MSDEKPVRAEIIQDVVHHRVGGRAGVRVEQFSAPTQIKRVSSLNDHSEALSISKTAVAGIRRVITEAAVRGASTLDDLREIESLLPR